MSHHTDLDTGNAVHSEVPIDDEHKALARCDARFSFVLYICIHIEFSLQRHAKDTLPSSKQKATHGHV